MMFYIYFHGKEIKMGLIYNPLKQNVQIKVFGNYFDFKPGQVKPLNDDVSRFIAIDKKQSGLVALPDICADDPTSEEAVAAKEAKRIEGITNALNHYKSIVHNLTVSLARDLAMKNDKTPIETLASDGEKTAMRMVKELTDEINAISVDKDAEARKLIEETKVLLGG